jgi:hypothetical protein
MWMNDMADEWEERARKAEDFIRREGYSRCDIPACNCGSWHGGHMKRRFDEIHDAMKEADISINGKTLIGALREHLRLEPL